MAEFLYVTSDQIGSSGATIMQHEVNALSKLGNVEVLNLAPSNDPFTTDRRFLEEYKKSGNKYKLAHFYAGTYTDTIKKLKQDGSIVSYTAAAHNIEVSKKEHELLGIPFSYPHLTDPVLWRQYIEGYLLADLIIVPSSYSKKIIEGYGARNINAIHHGVDLCDPLSIPKQFQVGFLGSPGADKGILYLIKAWHELNYLDSCLMVSGRGTENLLPLLRIFDQGNVYLSGFIEDINDLYKNCSILCTPSATEGFNLEVLEAMIRGRPVVCSNGAGAADCVVHGETGFVVPACNFSAIIDSINYYKSHPDKVIEHGRNAREHAKKYTWDIIEQNYQYTWRNLLTQNTLL